MISPSKIGSPYRQVKQSPPPTTLYRMSTTHANKWHFSPHDQFPKRFYPVNDESALRNCSEGASGGTRVRRRRKAECPYEPPKKSTNIADLPKPSLRQTPQLLRFVVTFYKDIISIFSPYIFFIKPYFISTSLPIFPAAKIASLQFFPINI